MSPKPNRDPGHVTEHAFDLGITRRPVFGRPAACPGYLPNNKLSF